MRVFLTGATGFIGGHILAAFAERGDEVVCLVRPGRGAAIAALGYESVTPLEAEFTEPDSWRGAVAGCDLVINAVGIIRETARSTFLAVHRDAPSALFEAAKAHGAQKVIQISAMGCTDDAPTPYQQSKRAGDRALEQLGVPYVILRPSFVYGPGDISMAFFTGLAAMPITPVPGDGQYRVQPLHVADLVRAVLVAADPARGIADVALDVGGAEVITFDHLLDVLARWVRGRTGGRGARKLHMPTPLMRLAAWGTDLLGGIGPITRSELTMLLGGNHGDNDPFVRTFGFEPRSFEVGIARRRRTQGALWHARLALLRVPLRLSVAFIWLATGIISLAFVPAGESKALMAQVGVTGGIALPLLYGTCALEILIGGLTALGIQVRLMALLQLLLMFGFMLLLTIGIPELWLHPFGPLTKNIPLIGATLVMIALEE